MSLTYAATITMSYDANQASSFPRTATNWRLEAKVDGAAVLAPVTGTVNEGGQIRTAPLPVVTAPFGGSQIVWSFVLLDATGNQVGTGVSAPFTNNDPTDPPAAVPITFSQIAVPITATTRFTRDDTTGWNSAAGGWTWSDAITVDGTQADAGVQQVAGVAVSTLAGAAAVVWEQGDAFYLRGVPTAQTARRSNSAPPRPRAGRAVPSSCSIPSRRRRVGATTSCSTPTRHYRLPRPRRHAGPHHGRAGVAPHHLVGDFPLEVSAATLHSSGRVVTVNTDSGRIGTLLPASASIPPTASYTAGTGVQIGLLRSPTAVAVTNPGTVLVLEPGPRSSPRSTSTATRSRTSGPRDGTRRPPGPPRARHRTEYRLALMDGSYLDLAVDGANQIYLLFYTGDGSETTDYGVDVLTPQGAVLNTGSTGVNVPHLAVDYWRSIYAGDYDALADTQTGHRTPIPPSAWSSRRSACSTPSTPPRTPGPARERPGRCRTRRVDDRGPAGLRWSCPRRAPSRRRARLLGQRPSPHPRGRRTTARTRTRRSHRLDVQHGIGWRPTYLYWTGLGNIARANLDGTGTPRAFLHCPTTPRIRWPPTAAISTSGTTRQLGSAGRTSSPT